MIENLQGIHETVNYANASRIMLYDNTDFEAYPTHWHTCVEIIMPIQNSYIVEYEKIHCEFHEDEILIICPGALHYLPACKGERYIFQAELGPFTCIRSIEETLTRLHPGILVSKQTLPEAYEEVHALMCDIIKEYHKNQSMHDAVIYAKLFEMLTLIQRSHSDLQPHFTTSNTKQKEYSQIFIQICNYIGEHCAENLTLDDVASLSGFSKYHFSRLFKQFTGNSFYKYLNIKRIAKAEQLLINPEMSITDVALSCGFSSLSSFIRMFKIIKQCTPSEFRAIYNL